MDDQPSRIEAVETLRSLRQWLLDATPPTTVEPDRIGARVLAKAIDAPRDDPPVSRSTMDGYAVASDDSFPLQVRRAEVYPEDEQPPMAPGEAVPVSTGGAIPERADAVLKREDVVVTDGQLQVPTGESGSTTSAGSESPLTVEPGTNVYARGSNFAAGNRLFERGERLSPKDAVLLDDLGLAELSVRERWSVGVLATGTELHEGTLPDRDSNMLAGVVRSWGHDAVHEGTVPDDPDRLRDRLLELADRHDVVVTSGGTSVGSRDHLTEILAECGEVRIGGCAISPGSSTTVGTLPGTVVVAVPGRPVAAHAAAVLFARPLLTGLATYPTLQARADHDIALGPGRECLVPVSLESADDHGGSPQSRRARLIGTDPAAESVTFRPSVFSSMTRATRADGFVLTDEAIAAGDPIDVVPYAGVEQP